MDVTGFNALQDLFERLRRRGKHLILSAPHTQPLFMMDEAGFLDRLGRENVCANIDLALARSREVLGLPPAPSADPLFEEKRKLEAARQELTGALERANSALNGTGGAGSASAAALSDSASSARLQTNAFAARSASGPYLD